MRIAFLIPVSALLISDAFLLIGHGLLLTLLPVAANTMGFSDTEVALTGSAYFLGFVSGCMGTPYILQRVGHIRSFAVLATLYSAIILIFPWIPEFFSWLLLRFFVGAAISGLYMIIESWLNERANADNRGTILSVYTMLNLLMMVVGQQLLNLGTVSTDQLFGLAAIFISIAIIPVSVTLALAPAPVSHLKVSLPQVWRHSHIGLIGAVATGFVTGAFWSLAPVYARDSGFDTAQLTLFVSATVMGGALFQLPLGRLSDLYDRRIIIMYVSIAGALTSMLIVVAPHYITEFGGWLATLLAFLWGGMVMTLYAISLAHANDDAAPADFVAIGSGMLITYGISSAIGAPLASIIMGVIGPQGLYVFAGLCLFVFAVIIALRRRTYILPGHPESNEIFRPVADTTTPAAYEMDPRNEEEETNVQDKKGLM